MSGIRSWSRRAVLLAALGPLLVAAGCSETQEVEALCRRVPSLESSLLVVRTQLEDLSSTTPESLESAVTGLTSVLRDLNEFPPSAVAEELGSMQRAYEELTVSLRNVFWDGSIGSTDPAVASSIANLVRSDNASALADVRSFVERECRATLPGPVGAPVIDATTLPPPAPIVEPMEEGDRIYDAEDSRLRSFGYLIAGSVGLAITSEQALCVGRWVSESIDVLGDDADRVYQEAAQNAMQACVFAPPSTSVPGGSTQSSNG